MTAIADARSPAPAHHWLGDVPGIVDILQVRRVLGRAEWSPPRALGIACWAVRKRDRSATVIVSAGMLSDGQVWVHASISHPAETPSYAELKLLHAAAFGDGYAYQVFAPADDHVNIHEHALHLWGRADGAASLPDFAAGGSI